MQRLLSPNALAMDTDDGRTRATREVEATAAAGATLADTTAMAAMATVGETMEVAMVEAEEMMAQMAQGALIRDACGGWYQRRDNGSQRDARQWEAAVPHLHIDSACAAPTLPPLVHTPMAISTSAYMTHLSLYSTGTSLSQASLNHLERSYWTLLRFTLFFWSCIHLDFSTMVEDPISVLNP